MYWWINIAAILLMIVVLEIDPTSLDAISEQASHAQWQFASHIALAVALITFVGRYLWHTSAHSAIVARRSVSSALVSLLCLVAFLFAILTNALAQRLLLAEHAITDIVYVEAWVMPVGLSDRQLELTPVAESGSMEVTQGYRLLAELSNISVYDTVDPKSGSNTHHITNPFESSLSTNNSLSTDDKDIPTHLTSSTPLPQTMRVLLTSFDDQQVWLNTLKPNQKVYLQLLLRPLDTSQSAQHEFNEYRWLSTRHATATATILNGKSPLSTPKQALPDTGIITTLNLHRYHLREHLQQLYHASAVTNTIDAPNQHITNDTSRLQAMAVTLSLLTGDRSLIDSSTTALYRFAGISHLLAISGAHVLFLAILTAWLATTLINRGYPRLYSYISRWQMQLIIAVVVAFIYALFSGFDVPAARTAWMLLLVGGVRYLLLSRATFKLLLGLATLMAWQDIFVLWQAGFWLSFVAVALLVAYGNRQQHSANVDKLTQSYQAYMSHKAVVAEDNLFKRIAYKIYRNLRYFIALQLWMTLALLPVSLWLFGEVSLWGIVVNMLAIGLFGWVIVPLNLLAGLLYSFGLLFGATSSASQLATWLANGIWIWLFDLLNSFHHQLMQLQTITAHTGWLYTPITLPTLFIAMLVVLPWLLPTGLLSRLLSLPAMALFAFIISRQSSTIDILGLDGDSPSLVITPLSLNLPTISRQTLSATLLSTPFDNWLLLSDYPNTTHHGAKPVSAQAITDALIQSLGQYQLDTLTGVIVQTPSQNLADSVSQLKDSVAIQYYWQAGSEHLPNFSSHSSSSHSDTILATQPCQIEKTWQSPQLASSPQATNYARQDSTRQDSDNTDNQYALQIRALTGWQDIDDTLVWSCALQINTVYPVYFNGHLAQKKQSGSDTNSTPTHLVKAIHAIPTTDENNHTKLIINSAQHTRVWQLWQLMCPSMPLQHHWLSPPLAILPKDLADNLQPVSVIPLSADTVRLNKNTL